MTQISLSVWKCWYLLSIEIRLWNPDIRYSIRDSLPTPQGPILDQLTPFPPSRFIKMCLILFFHLCLRLEVVP